jgi:chemotaxis family two-component system response regulator Rcp1
MLSAPVKVLLVEDSASDIRLMEEVLADARMSVELSVVQDGVAALAFLRRAEGYVVSPRPDLILLDLNLPKKSGREVLAEIKSDPSLKLIPVVVLTTSTAADDVHDTYDLHANCYVTKPVDLDRFSTVMERIEGFWLATARLPSE